MKEQKPKVAPGGSPVLAQAVAEGAVVKHQTRDGAFEYGDVGEELGGEIVHIDDLVGKVILILNEGEEKEGEKGDYRVLDVEVDSKIVKLSTSASVILSKVDKAKGFGYFPLRARVVKKGRYFDLVSASAPMSESLPF